MRIWLPRYGRHRDPNVEAGDILTYSISAFHHRRPTTPTPWCFVAVGDYLDDPIGTVKLWTKTTGEIPKGWRQVYGSAGRFLRGSDVYGGIGDFANVGTTHSFADCVVIERYDNNHA
ncbi:MAG: hypothetical protein JXB62_22030 [Pirellulales bacterium]|nr:hypothetical protein [Pirellulales bacterium]